MQVGILKKELVHCNEIAIWTTKKDIQIIIFYSKSTIKKIQYKSQNL